MIQLIVETQKIRVVVSEIIFKNNESPIIDVFCDPWNSIRMDFEAKSMC